MSISTYLSQLQALLPRGAAWTREDDAELTKLLKALAADFQRIDGRSTALMAEANPCTTLELLTDWEELAGLPDPCGAQPQTIQQRRELVVIKLTSSGGQSRLFFIDRAAGIGYQITITEYVPFTVGSCAGDILSNGDWVFVWDVNASETTVRTFTVGSYAGEPLAVWGNELLECALTKLMPAHTKLNFTYGG